ncbi:uncharacterized protein HD556DRAFT_1314010 [Suillus plorans]|uniref:Uncharacterized protein n=1 Tax=Suillus plorans TaxID=116603 RepID=A0A9P7AAX3_9AGAM|nr:uncharacterized protein HD556DRAFT_1314010 [Suillus plorans]KAG1785740.1 hypothetical protein HD556DRAFT_1314010 [Suillus plorans]
MTDTNDSSAIPNAIICVIDLEQDNTFRALAATSGYLKAQSRNKIRLELLYCSPECHKKDWHPVFIDAIIKSNGAGFVGTRGFTMSTLASRRVQSWHDGATQLVRWVWPGADDH